MARDSFFTRGSKVINPTCPSCHKGGYSQREAADGRPEFLCGTCGKTWTCGMTGGMYTRLRSQLTPPNRIRG